MLVLSKYLLIIESRVLTQLGSDSVDGKRDMKSMKSTNKTDKFKSNLLCKLCFCLSREFLVAARRFRRWKAAWHLYCNFQCVIHLRTDKCVIFSSTVGHVLDKAYKTSCVCKIQRSRNIGRISLATNKSEILKDIIQTYAQASFFHILCCRLERS